MKYDINVFYQILSIGIVKTQFGHRYVAVYNFDFIEDYFALFTNIIKNL